jgi:hypothetical protein
MWRKCVSRSDISRRNSFNIKGLIYVLVTLHEPFATCTQLLRVVIEADVLHKLTVQSIMFSRKDAF